MPMQRVSLSGHVSSVYASDPAGLKEAHWFPIDKMLFLEQQAYSHAYI